MDATTIFAVVVSVGSMLLVGELAQELGRSQWRWAWIAAVIGPLAIPLLYMIATTSALRKMINAPRP
jgi:bacteriorhodopsin